MSNKKDVSKIKDMVYDQIVDEIGLDYFYKFIMPEEVLVGPGSTIKLGENAKELGDSALIITDQGIIDLGLHKTTVKSL